MKLFRLAMTALLVALLVSPGISMAERNDRKQPVNIEADRVTVDDRNKTHTFEGNVILTQGSLSIHGERVIVIQGADGFETGIATGGRDGLARFRQKRQGSNDYVEGQAERIEYDTRTEQAKLFNRATVSSGGDTVRGDYIEYDALTEQYAARSQAGSGNNGRVRAVIQPRGAQ